MIACYILYSPTLDTFYVGFTHESLETRISHHRCGYYHQSYTKISDDWELFLSIDCETISQALSIEKHIKRMKSTTYIRNLKLYPEIVQKLKNTNQ